jgi:hypothetical protein
MSNVYAIVGQSFQQIGGSCPEGFIPMDGERPSLSSVALEDGTWSSSQCEAIAERLWRDSELARADIQLLKVQDGATKYGTQKAWREYRNALRDWPESEDFPSTEYRPIAPDSKV